MFPLASSSVVSLDALPVATRTPGGVAGRSRQGRNLPRPLGSIQPVKRRILLADDDPTLLHLSETILVAEGYQVQSCSNAEQAFWSFRKQPEIDLLLTDINMPQGISGLDLAEMLVRERRDLPVVVMSGAVLNEAQEKLMIQRGWSFIDKPLSVPRLLSVLLIHLGRLPARSADAANLQRKAG